MGFSLTHRDPGRVDETLVEMAQGPLGLFLGLEADEAELAELAVPGELQAAVRQRAKGSEELPEPLLLHLGQRGSVRASGELGWKPGWEGKPPSSITVRHQETA